jgi:hypothetical protein
VVWVHALLAPARMAEMPAELDEAVSLLVGDPTALDGRKDTLVYADLALKPVVIAPTKTTG